MFLKSFPVALTSLYTRLLCFLNQRICLQVEISLPVACMFLDHAFLQCFSAPKKTSMVCWLKATFTILLTVANYINNSKKIETLEGIFRIHKYPHGFVSSPDVVYILKSIIVLQFYEIYSYHTSYRKTFLFLSRCSTIKRKEIT